MSNYATKIDLKNATGIDASSFAKKVNLSSFKSNADKLDIDKFKNVPTNSSNLKIKADKLDVDKLLTVPVDLSKLTDLVKNDVVKRDQCNTKMKNIEDKIPSHTNLATKTTLNAKKIENKGEITNLATKTAVNAAEYKIPSVNNLVNKNLTITQKLMKLEQKLLIIIIINILLLLDLIS